MTAKKMNKTQMLNMLNEQKKALALSESKNAELEQKNAELENAKTDLDRESKYFLKKDKSVYNVRNLTTSLKFFETQEKIMTEILKMNDNKLMSLNGFHKHLAVYLKENLK